MRARNLLGVGVAAFSLFLIILFPASLGARLVFANTDVRYGGVTGSVWHMTLENTSLFGVPLGRVQIEPAFWSLISGTPIASLSFEHDDRRGQVARFAAVDGYQLSDFTLFTEIGGQFGPIAVRGPVSVRGQEIAFDAAGMCRSGSADFRADILKAVFEATGGGAPILEGSVACNSSGMEIEFSGSSAFASVSGESVWRGERTIVADIAVVFNSETALPNSLKSALEFAGLRETNDGWRGQLNLDLY